MILKNALIFALFTAAALLPLTAHALEINLDSAMQSLQAADIAGKSEYQILGQLASGGNVSVSEESNASRMVIEDSSGRVSIFVFYLGDAPDEVFWEVMSYYEQEEGFRLVGSRTVGDVTGAEYARSGVTLIFARRQSILAEYRIEKTSASAEPKEVAADSGWLANLAIILVLCVAATAAFVIYMKRDAVARLIPAKAFKRKARGK